MTGLRIVRGLRSLRQRRGATLAWTLAGLLAACGGQATNDGEASSETNAEVEAAPPPDRVRIADPGLHPEGVEWDAERGRFLVSSVTRGTVTEVRDDGTHSVFIQDSDIVSSIGIHLDHARGRLLVANSNVASFQGADGHAMLGAYDLESGNRLFMADLGATADASGAHFANDVTVGPDGTAYVTDSLTPVIYAVSTEGDVSVLARDGLLAEGGFLNGIEYHPDGYLLVALGGAQALLKVELGPEPTVTRVETPEPFGADGLSLMADGRLVAVVSTGEGESARSEVLLLTSADGWATAEITARVDAADDATTAAIRGDAIYVVDARFADMGAAEPAPHFDITRVRLP